MNTIIVVIASAAGLTLGYATAAHFASRAKALLLEQFQIEKSEAVEKADLTIRELRDELSSEHEKPSSDNDDASKSRSKKKGKNKNKNKNKKSGGTESSEVTKLKNAQADLEKTHSAEIKALKGANTAALAELEQAAESQKTDFSKALHSLQQELDEAKEVGAAPAGNAEFVTALEAAGSDLSPILEAIISNETQSAAVLADASGIIVAQSGDSDLADRISASASVLTGIPSKLEGMLPLDNQYRFRLSDQSSTITGRTFDLSGDTLALFTVGTSAPADDSIDLAINSLHRALE